MVVCGGDVLIRGVEMRRASLEAIAQPQLIVDDVGEYLLVDDCSLVAHYQKLLPVPHQLRHILAEQRERRVCDHHVGLPQQLDAFRVAEVARRAGGQHVLVVLQQVAHIGKVDGTVAVLVAHLADLHLVGCLGGFAAAIVEVQ